MEDFFKFVLFSLFGLFCLLASPFVICHAVEHWNAPEPPHSGFTPESPNWTEPENENTLPPTYSYEQ